MRLDSTERSAILTAARKIFGPEARVRLFGSRLDSTIRGGDIDLLVEVDKQLPNRIVLAAEMEAQLMLTLGEQKFDVLVMDPGTPREGIFAQALATGRLLS